MRLSKRIRTLAWEGLGWSAAAGLAIALAVTVALGLARESQLRARVAAAEARNATAARSLAVCEATSATLRNALTVVEATGRNRAPSGPLTSGDLLARRAAGADACARALEAEDLVREAAR
jgi:hypothetical protein